LKRVIIVGGGLAGLIAAIQFARAGVPCTLIEKKKYPFHRVCGEYISNEVTPFLQAQGLYPNQFKPPQIQNFQLSAIDGKSKIMPLDLGGFGISRYAFDHFLFEEATRLGVDFKLNEEVLTVKYHSGKSILTTQQTHMEADVIIGAFGKRSKLDHHMKRYFIQQRSPYVGVKYHIRTQHPDDLIALHNFPGGYCGVSNIEDGKTTLCYLSHRDNLKHFKNVHDMEAKVVSRNPFLHSIFSNAEFLFDKPEVINEISFVTKLPVEHHILMIGDAAGMVAPLCGNGMAMAIQSARLLTNEVIRFLDSSITRQQMEENYTKAWNANFKSRLWLGRQVQKLFGRELSSRIAVSLVMNIGPLARGIIRSTHGEPF